MLISATINGQYHEFSEGVSILDAAKSVGIEIPTLCYAKKLLPEGGCRMCLVETNRGGRPVAACHTPIEPGMEIQTHTPRVEGLRREILSLYLSVDGGTGFLGDGRESPFTRLLRKYGLPVPAAKAEEGVITRKIETWTYDLGPNRFITIATLQDGKVIAVEHGGYGYRR